MKRCAWIILALVTAMAWGGAVELVDDPPPAPKPKVGNLSGQLTNPDKVKTLQAICRATGKTYSPATFDKTTGAFTFTHLPGDASYDLQATTVDDRSIEGIDLHYADAKLLRLAELRRAQLGLPQSKPQPFTRDDVAAIQQFTRDWEDFLDYRRVLYIHGDGDRATVLVELMRTTEFHASQDDLVWRIELWYMRRAGGGWERLANAERVLRRVRGRPGDWRKISVEYFPELSVFVDRAGKSNPVTFTIPDKPDASRGRPAYTKIEQDAKPHVSGLDEPDAKKSPVTSQPASMPCETPAAK